MHLTLEADYAVRIVDKLAIDRCTYHIRTNQCSIALCTENLKKIGGKRRGEILQRCAWRLYDCKRPKRHYFARGD